MYDATVLADSVSPHGVRLLTLQVTLPRIMLPEFNTHRVFGRNSASTRAIPLVNQVRNVLESPFIPEEFGVNQPGMQHSQALTGIYHERAVDGWLTNRDRAVTGSLELVLGKQLMATVFNYNPESEYLRGDVLHDHLEELDRLIPKSTDLTENIPDDVLNVHKQLASRGLEAYIWHTVIVTATEFDNFFALRDHPDAQGQIATVARLMREAIGSSRPKYVGEGLWHLPLVEDGEFEEIGYALRASVARTAAVSYMRHQIARSSEEASDVATARLEREVKRHDALLASGHFSPFEHQATPFTKDESMLRSILQQDIKLAAERMKIHNLHSGHVKTSLEFLGNLRGWTQYRKLIYGEENFGLLGK